MSQTLQQTLESLRKKFLMAGAAGIVVTFAGFFIQKEQFFQSYLLAYLFWAGISFGALALLLIHCMTAGNWGHALRWFLLAAVDFMPFLAVLFIPVVLGAQSLYPWTHEEVAKELGHKAAYLNLGGFIGRAAFSFLVWSVLVILVKKKIRQERPLPEGGNPVNMQALGGLGILAFALAGTLASVDWVMSIEPHWFSTIYGLVMMQSQALSALAFGALLAHLFSSKKLLDFFQPVHFHDFGNLLLAFVMLWAYLGVSQLIIVWCGNLPEEVTWYVARFKGGWEVFGLMLVVFHFVVPFFLLLMRGNKKNSASLAKIAVLILVMQFAHLVWLIVPEMENPKPVYSLFDFSAWVGLGGLWLSLFFSRLKAIPVQIPQVAVQAHH